MTHFVNEPRTHDDRPRRVYGPVAGREKKPTELQTDSAAIAQEVQRINAHNGGKGISLARAMQEGVKLDYTRRDYSDMYIKVTGLDIPGRGVVHAKDGKLQLIVYDTIADRALPRCCTSNETGIMIKVPFEGYSKETLMLTVQVGDGATITPYDVEGVGAKKRVTRGAGSRR